MDEEAQVESLQAMQTIEEEKQRKARDNDALNFVPHASIVEHKDENGEVSGRYLKGKN